MTCRVFKGLSKYIEEEWQEETDLFMVRGVEHSDRRDLEGEPARLLHTSDTLATIFFLWKLKEALVLVQEQVSLMVFKPGEGTESFLLCLDWL